jgi:DNA-binding CsgD family transcriptional regulator
MLNYDNINFDTLPLWLSFILCLSITAGGLLILFRFHQTRKSASFQYLQYFLILLYVYGYYSLWSGILLSGFMQIENVERIAQLLAQMGAPFLLVSLAMLLVWAARLQKRPVIPVLLLTAGSSATIVLALVWSGWSLADSLSSLGSVVAITSTLVLLGVLLTGKQRFISRSGKRWLMMLIIASGIMHLLIFTPLTAFQHFNGVFAFLFYLVNTAMVVIYCYQATEDMAPPSLSLDDMLRRYGISKREADVLRGIYAGQTNQEIANQLYISLQTVKDHSSRIYQKTFVKNRAQLTTLIRESQNSHSGAAPRP